MTVPLRALRTRIRDAHYLRKWLVLGAVIGAVSGMGAVTFMAALQLATHLFLGVLAGFSPSMPVGEGARPFSEAARPWALPLVVALGGLISGIIVFRLAPEAEGHGTDAAIHAVHHAPKQIRARIPLIKLVASAITIGSGGSAGREGPTAQIGAGFGSVLARWLDLDARDARIAVAAGMGAGIGAIFRAPLGGAVLAAEIPYKEDIESEVLIPAFVASIVAFAVFGTVTGFTPIFGTVAGAAFTDPRQLVYYALIGVVAGLVGRLYVRSFYGLTAWFRRWPLPREVRPAIAGFAVGCIGLVLPGVLGTGYGWVQTGLGRDALLAMPLWVVLVLPFAKILATSLSIGSGGSGGVFGPGMVIGGLLGAGVWRLLEGVAPAVPADPSGFVIVAMMAMFGAVSHAPLAMMLMVAEMTDNLGILAPAMLAIGIALVIVGPESIYESQLPDRTQSPAHRFRSAMPLLASLSAGAAARAPRLVLGATDSVAAAVARLDGAEVPGAPVVERDGAVRGVVDLVSLRAGPADALVAGLADPDGMVSSDATLDEALGVMAGRRRSWLAVASARGLVGVLSMGDLVDAYRRSAAATARRMGPAIAGGALVEARVAAGSGLDGAAVGEVSWPADAVVVAIERGAETIVPRGDVALSAGDVITLFSTGAGGAALAGLFGSTPTAVLADG